MDREYEWLDHPGDAQAPGATHQGRRKPKRGRFQDLLEAMPDAIVIVSSSGVLAAVNTQTGRLFGYEPAELLGQPVELLMPERFRQRHAEHRGSFFANPGSRPMGVGLELYGRRRDGGEFPVEISLSPLEAFEGNLVAAAIRDISDRRDAQLALQEKNLQLEAAMLAKDRFLAAMSHELRTPLNSIIGFTGALLMRLPGPLTAEQESQLNTVKTSARHLLLLINDLLDMARVESDRPALAREELDCKVIVQEVVDSLTPLARARKLELRHEPPSNPCCARADRRALSQILINLVNNAIKFTDQGSIEISLDTESGAHGSHVVITVADTGRGIRPEDLERLYQPFSRIEHQTYQGEGTGLGLYLTKRLVEAQRGSLSCQSEFGRGSTFRVSLEAACQPQS